jgi:hypothetical protein
VTSLPSDLLTVSLGLGRAPKYLLSNFMSIALIHTHNTRGSNCDYSISQDGACFQTSFAYTAMKHWNSLPIFLKQINLESVFRTELRRFLVSQY